MSRRFEGKVALVTGGAGGVGRETALRLAGEGARVAITDLNEAGGQAVAAELGAGALFLRHDVADEADWVRVVDTVQQQLGPLDALVNNAGILVPGTIESTSLADWRRVMQVNADSVFLGTQAGVRAMKTRGGAIVNIASISSWLPIDGYAAYSASKAAVGAVTRTAALYCRKNGSSLRVNSVHPDGIWTPMLEASLKGAPPGIKPQHLLYDPQRNPKGRACMPADVASVVVFLLSGDAASVSGAEMRVDNAVLGMGL